MKCVVATRNLGKFREIATVLEKVELVSLRDLPGAPEVVEDQFTFQGNAMKKAREIHAWYGLSTLADDSGLVVDALSGLPGVHSARYAGRAASDQENCKKLLRELQGIPLPKRQARYVCVLVLKLADGREFLTEGSCEGGIAMEARGSLGFGYDPVFFVPEFGKTMAEISLQEKNGISHRGQALQKMACLIGSLL